jgi:hypothetical protein
LGGFGRRKTWAKKFGVPVDQSNWPCLLKQERVHWRHYETRYDAQQNILNYITIWLNKHRLHYYLDYQSLNNFKSVGKALKMVVYLG